MRKVEFDLLSYAVGYAINTLVFALNKGKHSCKQTPLYYVKIIELS